MQIEINDYAFRLENVPEESYYFNNLNILKIKMMNDLN